MEHLSLWVRQGVNAMYGSDVRGMIVRVIGWDERKERARVASSIFNESNYINAYTRMQYG